jgi:hypothetical protein
MSNQGLQADGGPAVVFGSVVPSLVSGSAAPAAEPWALAVRMLSLVVGFVCHSLWRQPVQ